MSDWVTIALPKGRVLKAVGPMLAKAGAGVEADVLFADDRSLVRERRRPAFASCFWKPDDVPTYVEYGAADLGVVGRDTLLENDHDLYQPVDLGVGRCRLVVAGVAGRPAPTGVPRVGTKFTRCAAEHFARRGVQAEVIKLHGSVELAPVTGLTDLIVDLVETGSTLAQNGLEERELVANVTSVLIANRAASTSCGRRDCDRSWTR